MIQPGDTPERHAIPRWNNIDTARELGELSPVKQEAPTQLSASLDEQLKALMQEWRIEQNLPLAVEILSIAQFSSNTIDVTRVRDYAYHAVQNMDSPPQLLLDTLNSTPILSFDGNANDTYLPSAVYTSIASIKGSLSTSPRNPLNWCELARQYLILGQTKQCERALQVANALAPNHRVILRSMAHFYSHIEDIEQGLYYLRNSDIVTYDPWVLASEIALSNKLKRTSRLIKHGMTLIENTNINPKSLSELASELGTMDFMAGNKKRGRKKLEVAKKAPHENSVAQMTWINQKVCNIEPIMDDISEPKYNYEAETKWHVACENWNDALDTTRKWQSYQPFAKEPALEGSYIAADFLDNPRQAITMLERGRLSNPHDISLLNNYIYSLVMANDFKKASELLSQTNIPLEMTADHIPLIATHGLLCFRSGEPELGRNYYHAAIEHATRLNRMDIAYRVKVYFAREEKLVGNDVGAYIADIYNKKDKLLYTLHRPLIERFGLSL